MRYGLQGRFGLYYGQEWDKDKVLLHVAASAAASAENASIVELGLWIIKLGWVLANTYECGWCIIIIIPYNISYNAHDEYSVNVGKWEEYFSSALHGI